jgi:hypothetical protein
MFLIKITISLRILNVSVINEINFDGTFRGR